MLQSGGAELCKYTQTLKHLLSGGFFGVDHDAFLIQHQDVHGQPAG